MRSTLISAPLGCIVGTSGLCLEALRRAGRPPQLLAGECLFRVLLRASRPSQFLQGEFLLTRPRGLVRVGVLREAFLQALLPGALGSRAAVLSCQQRALGKEDLGKVRRMRFPAVRLKKVERLSKIRSTVRRGPLCSRRQCSRGTLRSEL